MARRLLWSAFALRSAYPPLRVARDERTGEYVIQHDLRYSDDGHSVVTALAFIDSRPRRTWRFATRSLQALAGWQGRLHVVHRRGGGCGWSLWYDDEGWLKDLATQSRRLRRMAWRRRAKESQSMLSWAEKARLDFPYGETLAICANARVAEAVRLEIYVTSARGTRNG